MESTTRTNTQVVQAIYARYYEGDIPGLLDELTEDVKWNLVGPADILPWMGIRNGKEEVGEFFRLINEHNEYLAFEPKEYVAEGENVVVLGYLKIKSKKTGKLSESDWSMLFKFRNGKVSELRQFSDTYSWVEAFKD